MTKEYQRNKVADFFIGVGISIGISLLGTLLQFSLYLIPNYAYSNIGIVMNTILSILSLIMYVGLVIYFFIKNLKWIAIGMLSTILIIPLILLLIFGACLIVIGASGGF